MNKSLRIISLFLLFPALANAMGPKPLSQGPLTPGTGADDNAFGTTVWSNPGNITASDNAYATATTANGVDTHYLKGTNFGFSIPADASIRGILLEIERKGVCTGCVIDSRVRLIKGGIVGSTDRASGTGWDISESFVAYGSSSDLWGTTWTALDINDSSFGAVLASNAIASGTTASVDSVRITVYYALPINQSFPVDLDQVLN